MKRTVSLLAVLALTLAAPSLVMAQDDDLDTGSNGIDVSYNVAVTSDYVWRGFSQTNEDPAFQAGLDLTAGMFYAGVWGSNVDFGTAADAEVDGYLGFANAYESGFNWDVGVIRYLYPSESDLDFTEGYVGLGYKLFSVKYSYSNDFGGETTNYIEGGLDFALGGGISMALHAGQFSFDEALGLEDYNDYSVSFGKSFNHFDISAAYIDTDVENEPLAEDRVVFTLAASF